jgi:hypothetical protein
LRLISYAVFLLLLTVPALEWLLAPEPGKMGTRTSNAEISTNQSSQSLVPAGGFSLWVRFGILFLLLTGTVLQAVRYQTIFRRDGPKRELEFDVPYEATYDAAVAQPTRPIYLQDGIWGPAYMDALWYTTIKGRPRSEFTHLAGGAKPPPRAIVITSNSSCQNCEIIKRSGVYLLYRAK